VKGTSNHHRILLAVLTACGSCTLARAQSSIVLHGSAQVAPGSPVLLRDIALLTGDDAIVLGDVRIAETDLFSRGGMEVTPARVREVLRGHKSANLGRITISGLQTRVREVETLPETALHSKPDTAPLAAGGATVRDALPEAVARALGVDVSDLRLDLTRADATLLDTSLTGRTLAVSPTASSDPLPLNVRVYEGDRVVTAATIRLPIQVRALTATAARDLPRGVTITQEDLVTGESWVPPGSATASPDALLGQNTRSSLKVGMRIEARHVTPALVVRKGDLVSVDCVQGGVLIRATMRAKEDGVVGETITLEAMNTLARRGVRTNSAQVDRSRTQPIRGRVAGPGLVVVASPDPAPGMPLATSIDVTRPEDPSVASGADVR
jgi:flagella basal body P-ring formation protein FlgA